MTIGYEKAEKSAFQASQATGNVAKIALASGHPDWEILSQDQAEQFVVQGDKYLFGYGVPRSNETAFKRYMAAAKFGLEEACNMVGTMFENGLGREKDLPNAIFWFKTAAEKNHPDACNHLGRLYEQGKGLPKDYQKAAEFYLRAAEKNHPDAQTNLGGLFEKGLGQPLDYIKAANWYK